MPAQQKLEYQLSLLDRCRSAGPLDRSNRNKERTYECGYIILIVVVLIQKLEPFMTGCRSAAKLAMGVMQQFTSSKLGDTIQECKNLLEQHHRKIKDVFEDSRLSALQVEGEQILIRLQEDQPALPPVPDYIETVNCVTKLYHQMNEVFCKLEMLTDNRTRKLEQCLALKEFEKDIDEVKKRVPAMRWLILFSIVIVWRTAYPPV